MSRYFFHLVKGHERIMDEVGIEIEDEQFDQISLSEIVGEIASEDSVLFKGHKTAWFEIVDPSGRVVQIVHCCATKQGGSNQ